jgi:hypothetical protein
MAMTAPLASRLARATLVALSMVALPLACGDVLVEPLREPPTLADAGRDAAGGESGSPCDSPPFGWCADECVHLLTNDAHCGQCNLPCADGFHCVAGLCQLED